MGTAQYNEVKIDGTSSTLTVTGSVFGGEMGSSGTGNHANYNKVNITGAFIDADVYGGKVNATGNATNNEVHLTGGSAGGNIYGGYSALNNANNNKVEINGTTTVGTITGGHVDSTGGTSTQQANGNQVTISGGSVAADSVVGGITQGSDTANQASGNTVSIDGTTFTNFNVSVVGGQTSNGQAGAAGQGNKVILANTTGVGLVLGGEVTNDGNAQYNEVTIGTGASVSVSVSGGSALTAGNANYNKVTIAGGAVTWDVFGGNTIDGDASNNTVTYMSGSVGGSIYGGYLSGSSTGTAANNTVNLGAEDGAGLTVGGRLYGGYSASTGAIATGNTLNVEGVGHTVGGSLGGFETLNFRVASTISPGDTLLTVGVSGSGSADISGSTVNLAFVAGSSSLSGFTAGTSVINLIDASSGATGIVTNTPFIPGNASIGALTKYNFSLAVNGGNILVATLDSVSTTSPLDPRSKALSEGFLSGVAVLNQAQDFVAQQGINAALAAVSPAGLKQSLQGFAGVGGGNLRHDTGSHVDVDGYSLIAGAAFGKDTGAGTVTVGGFIEHGDSDYTSTNNFANSSVQSAHGKGDTKFTGFGALGRFDFTATNTGKAYVDGSVRVGRVKTDFDSDIFDGFGRSVSFDSKSRYLSAHVDGGYVLNLNARNTLDVYGQFLFSRQNGDSVHLSTGEAVKFKDVNSRRVRVGAKWNFTLSDESSLYAGAAWEHEYDGKANATLNDGLNRYKLDAPDLKGNTSILSVGLAIKPAAGRPLSLDVGIQSHTGKREGVTGSIRAGYHF
ncbi:membrane protein [Betaproteobacteria bacterium]|nr:membrane protein [Betaproteobacteria bacterium]